MPKIYGRRKALSRYRRGIARKLQSASSGRRPVCSCKSIFLEQILWKVTHEDDWILLVEDVGLAIGKSARNSTSSYPFVQKTEGFGNVYPENAVEEAYGSISEGWKTAKKRDEGEKRNGENDDDYSLNSTHGAVIQRNDGV